MQKQTKIVAFAIIGVVSLALALLFWIIPNLPKLEEVVEELIDIPISVSPVPNATIATLNTNYSSYLGKPVTVEGWLEQAGLTETSFIRVPIQFTFRNRTWTIFIPIRDVD